MARSRVYGVLVLLFLSDGIFASMRLIRRILFLAVLLLATGCSPYSPRIFTTPDIEVPKRFSKSSSEIEVSFTSDGKDELPVPLSKDFLPYWEVSLDTSFGDYVEELFLQNFSLQEAMARVRQAQARARIAGAEQYPSLDVGFGGSRAKIETGESIITSGVRPVGSTFQNNFFLQNGLSFELDLWRRIGSQVEAGELRVKQQLHSAEQVKLLLSQSLYREYLNLKEAKQLQKVLSEQIRSSETFLELTNLRYTVGRGTALDVLEQRQQLASLKTQLPVVKRQLTESEHGLAVLLGRPPTGASENINPMFSPLEGPPSGISPIDLLVLRPDLRASLTELQAGEYDLARAVAERFPRLSIGFDYNFSTSDLDDLFPNKTATGLLNGMLPLIDGARRRGVVAQEEAEVEELFARFSRTYLEALQEVEDAYAAEQYQQELIASLRDQYKAAEETLEESQARYRNGLVEYLRVLVALQSKQQLERELISQEKHLLLLRNTLYIALGGKIPQLSEVDDVSS